MILPVLTLLLVSCVIADQTSPGTATRPILSSSEAAYFTRATYLTDWSPSEISLSSADYTVGSGGYSTVQAAVNAAINAGGTTRKYIAVSAGTYAEVVYIPSTNVPLTIYGTGSSSSDTVIALSLSALASGSSYSSTVGSLFSSGDPAYSMYESCASKSAIGTSCSSVFWVKASNVQIVRLTIQNSSKNTGTDQAVALQLQGDKVQIHDARLLGHQDTFYAGGGSGTQRSIVTSTYIEGDIDFVFGGGAVVFESCTFYAKGDRRTDEAVVFAPDTDPNHEYGFLVVSSTISGDSTWSSSKGVYLGRSWDAGVSSASDYVAGTSPNGQLVIRETSIGGIINTSAPYTTATSGRSYSGNAASSRDLNNQNYNRFWEYANTGSGA
uniref:Pectinesterase n=1 Tax=Dendroctonus ponderosae TaxID=77166 RepID=J3JZ64_DENPD|nr:unknown [Dendroctonus ponderosae]